MGVAKSTRRATVRHVLDPSDPLHQRIETERRRLQKADAILACLVFAVNHDAPSIDAADVAAIVSELISAAVDGLDIVKLQR